MGIIIINKNNEGSAAVLVSNDEGVATRSKRSLGIERYAQLSVGIHGRDFQIDPNHFHQQQK
jgi:hypothetical protein